MCVLIPDFVPATTSPGSFGHQVLFELNESQGSALGLNPGSIYRVEFYQANSDFTLIEPPKLIFWDSFQWQSGGVVTSIDVPAMPANIACSPYATYWIKGNTQWPTLQDWPFATAFEWLPDSGSDCNDNYVMDACEIANGSDCNNNGVVDECDIANGLAEDCNGNGVPDNCELSSGSGLDQDGNGILDECLPPPLGSNPVQISVASGGQHDLTLTAPQEYGGGLYFVLGSSSGTVPGWTVDGVHLPLQVSDSYFLYGISSPNVSPFINTLGTLSATGTASAAIAVPSGLTDLAGVTIHHAYVLFGNSLEVVYASNAAPLELVP